MQYLDLLGQICDNALLYTPSMPGLGMPKGLTQSSSLITIGARVEETGANTFTQQRIDLQLNPLDNEVFVVQAIDMDPQFPESVGGVRSAVSFSLTNTTQATFPLFNSSSVLAQKIQVLDNSNPAVAVYMDTASMETPPTSLDYISIIATNDFFLQLQGSGQVAAKAGSVKLYGYRATAKAAVYAALVQSELLSQ
jgi:hypothetical protein